MSRPFANRNTASSAPGVRLRSVSDGLGRPLPTAQSQATPSGVGGAPRVTKDAPRADFTLAPASGSAPLAVQFTDTSEGGPVAWSWDLQADGVVDSHDRHPVFTYTEPGTYSVRMAATNADGGAGFITRAALVTVWPPIVWSALPANVALTAGVDAPSALQLAPKVSGGVPPYTFSVATGALPAGLELDPSTGIVSGKASAAGTASLTFRVTDAVGVAAASGAVTFTIAAAVVTDPQWASVMLRMPFDADILDKSPAAIAFSELGSGSVTPYAGGGRKPGAARFGANGWLAATDAFVEKGRFLKASLASRGAAAWRTWGTGDFCIEFWLRVASVTGGYMQSRLGLLSETYAGLSVRTFQEEIYVGTRDNRGSGIPMLSAATIGTIAAQTEAISDKTKGKLLAGVWQHIAVSRASNVLRVFIDGVIVFQSTSAANFDSRWNELTIGGSDASSPAAVSSAPEGDAIDDVRVTVGHPRYTAAFVPPTAALPLA